jgi:Mrp family chromosome partitioning ATPase/capsular polysaccharide biosynthesis protein
MLMPTTEHRPQPTRSGGPSTRASAHGFLNLLWRHRLVALLAALAVAGSIAAGLAVSERQYTADARVEVMPPADVTQSPVDFESLLGTVAAAATSRSVLADVADTVGGRTVQQLLDATHAAPVPSTVLVQISVTDPDRELAARLANAIAEQLPRHEPARAGALEVSTAERASVPRTFSSPNLPVTVLAGVVLALLAAVAAATLVDAAASTVRTAEEVGALAGVPVLGVLRRPGDPGRLDATDPASPSFAGLRALRVALEFASSRQPTRSLVVAPPGGGEPCPGWLDANLAVGLAEIGHRVLLVDSSRSGSRHPLLADADAAGLYDVLSGAATLADVVQAGPVAGVGVVPVGDRESAAPSLLEMRFRDFLAEADKARFDVVVVRADPLSESEDARVMAIDGALLLSVHAGRVRPRVLQRARAHLAETQTRVLGAVLTGPR